MKHLLTSSIWLVLLLASHAADSQSTEAVPSAVQPIDNGPGPVDPPEPSAVPVDPPGRPPSDTPLEAIPPSESSVPAPVVPTTSATAGVIADTTAPTVFNPTPTSPPTNPEPTEPSLPVEKPPSSTVAEGILPPQSPTQAAVGQSSAPVDGPTSAQGTVTTPEASAQNDASESQPPAGSPAPAPTKGTPDSATPPEVTSRSIAPGPNTSPEATTTRPDVPGGGEASPTPTNPRNSGITPSSPPREGLGSPDQSSVNDETGNPATTEEASPSNGAAGNTDGSPDTTSEMPAQTDARGSSPNGEISATSRATNEEATLRDQPSASTRSGGDNFPQTTSTATRISTDTTRAGDSSRGSSRPTKSSSSLAPLSTAKPSDGTGFLGIDLSDGTESSEETPPDTTTPEQYDAEAEANLPFTVISDADAQDVAILEAAMFEYFVENDAQIGDDVQVTIPAVASNCDVGLTRRDMGEERWPGRFKSPVAKRQANCKVVTSLEFDLYFHYMLPSQTAERPNQLSERITASVEYVQSVFGLRNISFTYVGVNFYTPDKDDANWTTVRYKEDRLETWMGETRKGDKMSLNVWLVNDLKKGEGDDERDINEYSTFPEDNSGLIDGIVMRQAHISDVSPTSVHNIGHWLGLRHTFSKQIEDGEQDCVADTGLLSSTQTSGLKDTMYSCSQKPCFETNARNITNFMSFSSCRGDTTFGGFSIDQKAAIWARVIQFRRTNAEDECQPSSSTTTKSAIQKRSSMQDLVDGKCPDLTAEAERIRNQPVNGATGSLALGPWGWCLPWLVSVMMLAP
ncbi:metalloprotease [Verticillium dahliae]